MTYTGTYHCNDLTAVCHLRCEKDYTDEDKQCTEKICIIGNEVQIVLHDNGLPRSMRLSESVNILVEIEHNTNTYNKYNGKEVSS